MKKTVKYTVKSMLFAWIVFVNFVQMNHTLKLICLAVPVISFFVILCIPSREKHIEKMHQKNLEEERKNQKEIIGKQKKVSREHAQQMEEEKLQRDLKVMKRTRMLTSNREADMIVEPVIVTKEMYEPFFAPFNRGDMIFPAIPPLFEELLSKEDPTEKTVREFSMRNSGYSPIHYFASFERDPAVISLSANQILSHFISNIGYWAEENWYVLNTKPAEPPTIKNLRMVDIRLVQNADIDKGLNPDAVGKYFLYCYNYGPWSIMGGGYLGSIEESKFFVPVDSILEKASIPVV